MTTIVLPDEDNARPSKRLSISYKRNGELIKTKIREALYRAMENSKARLADATGKNYSQTILVRRALDLYLAQLGLMTTDQLILESHNLVRHRA